MACFFLGTVSLISEFLFARSKLVIPCFRDGIFIWTLGNCPHFSQGVDVALFMMRKGKMVSMVREKERKTLLLTIPLEWPREKVKIQGTFVIHCEFGGISNDPVSCQTSDGQGYCIPKEYSTEQVKHNPSEGCASVLRSLVWDQRSFTNSNMTLRAQF